MLVLDTRKFGENPIKTEGAIESTIWLRCSRVGDSEVNTKMDVTTLKTKKKKKKKKKKNSVSFHCARGKSSIARKPEVHPKLFNGKKLFKNVTHEI